MDLNEFNDYYVNNLLRKLSKENKIVFLLDHFSTDFIYIHLLMSSLTLFFSYATASNCVTNKNKK